MAYRKTLLDIVQTILSSMDSDEVDSFDETAESFQVAEIVRDTYNFLMSESDWDHLNKLTSVDGLSDVSKPSMLQIPSDIVWIDRLTFVYDNAQGEATQRELEYMEPEQFLTRSYGLKKSDSNVESMVLPEGRTLYIFNDRHPEYYTIWDNDYIICDAYKIDEYNALHEDQFIVFAQVEPTWQMQDAFVPDMPSRMFPLLLAEATKASFLYLKQAQSPEDNKRAVMMRNRMNKRQMRAKVNKKTRGYGRK